MKVPCYLINKAKLIGYTEIDRQIARRQRIEKFWEWASCIGIGLLLILALLTLLFSTAWATEIDMSIIAKIESSNNPLAYNRHSGARGLYQITPICLKDYNQQNNAKIALLSLYNPKVAYKVAKWYLGARIPQLLQNKGIVVSVDSVLWAYNSGIGNVVKGIKPYEMRQYINRYHKLKKG